MLRSELDVEPDPQTQALERSLKARVRVVRGMRGGDAKRVAAGAAGDQLPVVMGFVNCV